MDYLVLDSTYDATVLTEKQWDACKDPAVAQGEDVTTRLVGHATHPDTGEEAIPLVDEPLPIRNPDPPTLPGNVILPDDADPEGAPNADPWHKRLPTNKWGTVKAESELEAEGWFPDAI